MTSMPASRAATAICSAPLEWPSRPGLATRSRGGPPAMRLHPLGHGVAARRSGGPRRPRPTPVGARYSPNTSRRAPAHSPVVPPAWARAMVAGMMFSPVVGHPAQLVEGLLDRVRGPVATARPARRRSARPRPRGRPAGCCSSPLERRRRRLGEAVDADHHELARLDAAGALGVASAPAGPSARRWPRRRRRGRARRRARPVAASTSSAVRASTTLEPSKMSSYSSRSVS